MKYVKRILFALSVYVVLYFSFNLYKNQVNPHYWLKINPYIILVYYATFTLYLISLYFKSNVKWLYILSSVSLFLLTIFHVIFITIAPFMGDGS